MVVAIDIDLQNSRAVEHETFRVVVYLKLLNASEPLPTDTIDSKIIEDTSQKEPKKCHLRPDSNSVAQHSALKVEVTSPYKGKPIPLSHRNTIILGIDRVYGQ